MLFIVLELGLDGLLIHSSHIFKLVIKIQIALAVSLIRDVANIACKGMLRLANSVPGLSRR